MKPFNEHFFGAVVGFALVASTALATGVGSYSSIERLPDEGKVSLNGTVSDVDDKDSFVLKDSAGKTIDVHTTSAVDLKVGDHVTVSGEVQDEALGMGQEIASATITTDSKSGKSSPSSPAYKSGASGTDDENRTKLNDESKAVPGYDVDVDVKKSHDKGASDY